MTALIIANTQIRRDEHGRYCLNDLHQASGASKRHQPANWMRLDQTQELIAEIENSSNSADTFLSSEERIRTAHPVESIRGGLGQGTYAVKELVYAYAMWISAKFHLHVIRAYDALVNATTKPVEESPLLAGPQHRADQIVSAGRVFSAAMRTARTLRLSPQRAVRSALACAVRHTGIDWAGPDGLDCADAVAEFASDNEGSAHSSALRFHDALVAGLLDGLEAIPGLSTDWYAHYCRWCAAAGIPPEAIGPFINSLKRYRQVRGERKRYAKGGQTVGPAGFLMLGDVLCPPNEAMTDWLGRCAAQVAAGVAPSLEPDVAIH